MTIAELQKELEGKDPRSLVQFQIGINSKDNSPILAHDVQRVDNFGHMVVIVIKRRGAY